MKEPAALLLAVTLIGPTVAQAQKLRFESRVDLVSVPIAVTDKDGNYVKDLGPEDFLVYEEGVRQEITLFAAGLEESWIGLPPELKEELSGEQVIAMILDASGSMEDEMRLVHQAALKFLTNIPRTRHLFVVDFDESIRISQYSSDDQRLISERIYDVEADGWTALYDAVATILERSYALVGRKTLVIYSDGVDSRSMLSISDCIDMVKATDVTIHSVHIGNRARSNAVRAFREGRFLRQISELTGGSYVMTNDLEQLDEIYDQILEELFSQYTIGYLPKNTERDGRYRKIKVEVKRKDVKVRARRGYQAPSPDPQPTDGR